MSFGLKEINRAGKNQLSETAGTILMTVCPRSEMRHAGHGVWYEPTCVYAPSFREFSEISDSETACVLTTSEQWDKTSMTSFGRESKPRVVVIPRYIERGSQKRGLLPNYQGRWVNNNANEWFRLHVAWGFPALAALCSPFS